MIPFEELCAALENRAPIVAAPSTTRPSHYDEAPSEPDDEVHVPVDQRADDLNLLDDDAFPQ